MTPETEAAQAKEDYYEMVNQVMKIDPEAAWYLRTHKPDNYRHRIAACFSWSCTPQGQKYWSDIMYEIGQEFIT